MINYINISSFNYQFNLIILVEYKLIIFFYFYNFYTKKLIPYNQLMKTKNKKEFLKFRLIKKKNQV